jgi:two-component system, OmpR family, sensor histidine kinase CreC
MAKMRDELRGKRYLEQYTQSLAHELKSPLSAIAASNELLADPSMSASDRQRFSQLNYEQTEKMRASIDRMLEAARTENLTALERHEPIDWQPFLEDVIANHQAHALSKEITLQLVQTAHSLVLANGLLGVKGDPNLLQIALNNLIKNSLDFTPVGGSVGISFELTKSNTLHCVETRIVDTGTGIPAFAVDRVKERFYSLARPDGTKGSGLGLSIVQHIALVHGGSFDLVNSTGRVGCTAIFTLPSSNLNSAR